MLIEQKIIDRIEIVQEGTFIQVREKNCILKDGVEIASNFIRYVISKEHDRSNLDPQVKKIADVIWAEEANPEQTAQTQEVSGTL